MKIKLSNSRDFQGVGFMVLFKKEGKFIWISAIGLFILIGISFLSGFILRSNYGSPNTADYNYGYFVGYDSGYDTACVDILLFCEHPVRSPDKEFVEIVRKYDQLKQNKKER